MTSLRSFMPVLLAILTVLGASTQARAADPAVEFMRRAANELINAQRQGSADAFSGVIKRYGHVPAIGAYALGSYREGLTARDRGEYHTGLVRFISRYAANESVKYPVSRVEFAERSVVDGNSILVDSRIILADGSTYDVRWLLFRRSNSYAVRDAQVIGFWVTTFLQSLFEQYIGNNGGRVDALVMALNR